MLGSIAPSSVRCAALLNNNNNQNNNEERARTGLSLYDACFVYGASEVEYAEKNIILHPTKLKCVVVSIIIIIIIVIINIRLQPRNRLQLL